MNSFIDSVIDMPFIDMFMGTHWIAHTTSTLEGFLPLLVSFGPDNIYSADHICLF